MNSVWDLTATGDTNRAKSISNQTHVENGKHVAENQDYQETGTHTRTGDWDQYRYIYFFKIGYEGT